MSNRAFRAQKIAIQDSLSEILEDWYLPTRYPSGIIEELPVIVEDRKTYRGKVLRWFEPWIPKVKNPVLVEEACGDSWTIRVEYLEQKEVVA